MDFSFMLQLYPFVTLKTLTIRMLYVTDAIVSPRLTS
jgi:hypothetical protein